jgi:hypothetical protein
MYASYTAPSTVDFCAAWCRLLRHSASYQKCNVFVFDGTRCYVGDIIKTNAYNTGPAGISDVYYDKGERDSIHKWCPHILVFERLFLSRRNQRGFQVTLYPNYI